MNITCTKADMARKILNVIYAVNGENIPHGTLTFIAKEVGVTRERVRQLMDNRFIPSHKQSRCCRYCGKEFQPYDKRLIYCSNKCRKSFSFYKHHTLEICEECGLGYLSPTNRANEQLHFCSKICQGKMVARNFGFKSKKYRYVYKGESCI